MQLDREMLCKYSYSIHAQQQTCSIFIHIHVETNMSTSHSSLLCGTWFSILIFWPVQPLLTDNVHNTNFHYPNTHRWHRQDGNHHQEGQRTKRKVLGRFTGHLTYTKEHLQHETTHIQAKFVPYTRLSVQCLCYLCSIRPNALISMYIIY